jgi:hypothetical protein
MECQLLYLLDYDLRIEEAELIHHFAPFFKKTTLVSSGTTPPAAQHQHSSRGLPHSASSDDVFTAAHARAVASISPRPYKRIDVVPISLSMSMPSLAKQQIPVTPEHHGSRRVVMV